MGVSGLMCQGEHGKNRKFPPFDSARSSCWSRLGGSDSQPRMRAVSPNTAAGRELAVDSNRTMTTIAPTMVADSYTTRWDSLDRRVDVGTTAVINQVLEQLVSRGAAAVAGSSDIEEVARIAHTVHVMSGGRMIAHAAVVARAALGHAARAQAETTESRAPGHARRARRVPTHRSVGPDHGCAD